MVAELLAEPGLDPGALTPRDALADDERGCRLVRGVKAHRPEVTVQFLEAADHRVALADRRPSGSVVIE